MEERKNSVDQQKKNKMVKIIVAILAIIIVLLLLRSCAKRESLKIQLSDEWFYSDDIATDVIENIISVNGYTLNHNGEMYISDDSNVIYREGGYEFEFIAKYGDVVIAVTSDDNAGQAECLVIQGVEWYLADNEGEDTATVTELYYSGTTPAPTGTDTGDDDTSSTPAPAIPAPSNPTDGDDSGSGDSDQPDQPGKVDQVELGGSLNNDHQVIVGGDDQPSGGSGDNGTGNGGSNNGSTSGNNGGTIVIIPDEDVTGTVKGEDNISNNPDLSHDSTSIGDRVVSKPAPVETPTPVAPTTPADNSSNNVSTDVSKPADGGASKPAPAPTPQPQPENPPVVVEAPAPADNNPAPADDAPAPSTDPNIVCDENGDCKIVW